MISKTIKERLIFPGKNNKNWLKLNSMRTMLRFMKAVRCNPTTFCEDWSLEHIMGELPDYDTNFKAFAQKNQAIVEEIYTYSFTLLVIDNQARIDPETYTTDEFIEWHNKVTMLYNQMSLAPTMFSFKKIEGLSAKLNAEVLVETTDLIYDLVHEFYDKKELFYALRYS